MKLQEVLDQLAYGELEQLYTGGGNDSGTLLPEQQRRLIHHIELGLNALYTRFLLKKGRLTLVPIEGRTRYPLTPAFAVSNVDSSEPERWIDDTGNAFNGDLLRIAKVTDTVTGCELPLNDSGNPLSLVTDEYNVLELPEGHEYTQLRIRYHAAHPKLLPQAHLNPAQISLELPETHLQALCLFVASRVLTPTGSTGEFHDGNNYATKYEAECQRLELGGYRGDEAAATNTHFCRGGWV